MWVVILVSALCPLAGCHSSAIKEQVWAPRPTVDWKHVALGGAKPAPNTFQVLGAPSTTGLFPANMGVTRVALEEEGRRTDGTVGESGPVLLSDPRNEFLRWNSTLDDQMAISEVFPVNQRDLGGGEAEPVQILAAFRALHARLGLIYAVNEIHPHETEMFGALFDTSNGTMLASLHAHATSIELSKEEQATRGDDPFNVWETDSRALVRVQFAELVHQCMRRLIASDQPQMMEAPAGWKPEFPTHPAQWPPRFPAYP